MDTSNPEAVEAVSSHKALPPIKRQRRSPELKRQIVEETLAPGASVARVARAHGVNADATNTRLEVLPDFVEEIRERGIVGSFLDGSARGSDVAQFAKIGFERRHLRGSLCRCLFYAALAFCQT
jgi:hypothetical protein